MPVKKVGIAAECTCDLPKSYLKEHQIDIVYFTIETDSGVFTDTDEITAENVFDYISEGGQKAVSSPPQPEVYEKMFRSSLKKYDEVIFICIGSGTSVSCERAEKAVSGMGDEGKRIHIFDSGHVSTGIGHVIIEAVRLAEEGRDAEEIITALGEYRERVSTSFITMNADYLYRNGRISQKIKKICGMFSIHPVLKMKNGRIVLKTIKIGNYEKASLRYVKSELKNAGNINKERIFITHAGCSSKTIERIKSEVARICPVEKIIVTKASATVSCNCGPKTFGVLFVNERKPFK